MDRRSFISHGILTASVAATRVAVESEEANPQNLQSYLAFKSSLLNDAEYAWSWQCNLAATSMEQGLSVAAANRAAANFLSLAFDLNMNIDSRFAATQSPENEQALPIRAELKDGAVVRHRDGRLMLVSSVLAHQGSLVECLLSSSGGEHPNSDDVTFSRPVFVASDLAVVGPDDPVSHHESAVNVV